MLKIDHLDCTDALYTHTFSSKFHPSQQAQISGVLFQLKDNPQVLEDVLEKVNEQYSPDLSQLIRTMLRRAFHQRPTMKEMIELPVVQECLRLSDSPLFKKARTCDKDGQGWWMVVYIRTNILHGEKNSLLAGAWYTLCIEASCFTEGYITKLVCGCMQVDSHIMHQYEMM